ncbi:Uncharacterized protein TCM_008761 [Theobroma cacao]|uniref:Uncharacterized protein n=1 Tax=Theobroma cacao TaxID=3641 RepID=A0A061E637_THECC|nr:Uncharacterized protein TCM_008761 [Theobroma cacao]
MGDCFYFKENGMENDEVVRRPEKAKELRLRTISQSSPEIRIFDTYELNVNFKRVMPVRVGNVYHYFDSKS